MISDVALIVSSCDKYSVAWEVFAHGINKYWPDCPYNIYFITGFKDAPIGKSIKVGEDKGWSNNMLTALDSIEESVVLMMVEDYWLFEQIDTKIIQWFVNAVRSGEADQIRLSPSAEATPNEQLEEVDVIPNTAFYIASLQPSIWKKDYFRNFVRPDENVWQFEQRGGERIVEGSRNFCTKKKLIPFWLANPIQQGKWTNDARTYAEREGLLLDTSLNPSDLIK